MNSLNREFDNTLSCENLEMSTFVVDSSNLDFQKVEIKTGIIDINSHSEKITKCQNFKTAFIKFIFPIALILTWIIFYLIALLGCETFENGPYKNRCQSTFSRFTMLNRSIWTLASSTVYSLFVIFTFYELYSKKYFISTIPIGFYLFYIHDTGYDNLTHGVYARLLFYFFTFILLFSFFLVYFIIRSCKTIPILTILSFSCLLVYLYFYIQDLFSNSCNYWRKGFKNTSVASGGSCEIVTPKFCYMVIISGFLDISKFRGMDCHNFMNQNELTELKFWTKLNNSRIIGLPRTDKFKIFDESLLSNIQDNVFNQSFDWEEQSNQEKKELSEVYINFTNYPEVFINLKKNETLIKERKELYERQKNHTMGFRNILYIFSDSLSRNHMKLKLPKTYSFFEKFYKNEKEKLSSYQFLKYFALAGGTFLNMLPGLFGVHSQSFSGDYYLYQAKAAGYITGQAYNGCTRELFDLEDWMVFYNFTGYDHELINLYCDPNFFVPKIPYSNMAGPYSITRKCLYKKDSIEYSIEYAKQFFEKYSNEAKIFRLGFIDPHEMTGEVAKYMDPYIFEFLNFLEKQGHLDDTLVIFQSDHGQTINGIIDYFNPDDYWKETFLPCLLYLLPKNINNFEEIDDNLRFNENVFTQVLDAHASLLNVFDKEKINTRYGLSLFANYIDDKSRSCNTFKIQESHCICGK